MKYPAIKYNQSNYSLVSTVLPFSIINKLSKTLIYGKDEGGYQREQDQKHYLNIKKYIDTKDFIFPNSIILAIDEWQLEKISSSENEDFIYLNLDNVDEKILRVVDGQHRLLGVENALSNDPTLQELKLQVTLILTPENKRSIEMEIFSNINSKAKRLKTDLIELAKYDFRIIENKIGKSELNQHIAINTAFYLNEDLTFENVWQNAIKIDIHSEHKVGIIGVKAFSEAISGIVSSFLNKDAEQVKKLGVNNDLIIYSRTTAKELSAFIIEAWKIVHKKWSKAFLEPYKSIDIDNQYKSIVYNPSYYIQKTLGCKSINYMLSDLLKEKFNNKFNTEVLSEFEAIIFNSKLNDYDWLLGKTLSGISSESGFNKVSRIIKNQEEFIRKE